MKRAELVLPAAFLLVATLVAGAALLAYTISLAETHKVREPCILSVLALEDNETLVYNPCRSSVKVALLPQNATCTVILNDTVLNTTTITLPGGAAMLVRGACKGMIADGRVYSFQ